MSGLNITRPVYQIRAVNGVAKAGWMLRFFQINSGVEKEVYEDIGRTVVACQPVILNSEGWWAGFAGDGNYTVREYDSDGVLKDCFDMAGANGSGGAVSGFALVATMQAMRELTAGSFSYVVTQGYDAYGDGCGGEFDWIPDASNPDDGVTWVAPISFPATGRYRLRNATALTTRMAGDPGDLDSSYETLTRLAAAAQAGDNVILAPGLYKLAASQEVEFAAGVAVIAEDGAKVDTADASAIRILGTFAAPVAEVFTGQLNVTFGSQQPLAFPEWFGGHGDGGDTDNTDAFLALFASGALLYTLPGTNGYVVESDVSPSIPGNAIFIGVSDVSYSVGPVVLIEKGIYSANGHLNFASIKTALATFITLAVTGAASIGGNVTIGGSASITGAITGLSLIVSGIVQGSEGSFAGDGNFGGNLSAVGDVSSQSAVNAGQESRAGTNVLAGEGVGATEGYVRAKAGIGSAKFKAAGNLFNIVGNGAGQINLNSLVNTGDSILIKGSGTFGNGPASDFVTTITVGGVLVLTSGTSAPIGSSGSYYMEVTVTRTGATTASCSGFSLWSNIPAERQALPDARLVTGLTWANNNAVIAAVAGTGITNTQSTLRGDIFPV